MRTRDTGIKVIRVTAGLHRQVWVSGTRIYVDVHIVNESRKIIKKIELQLERDILCYKHVRYHTRHRNHSLPLLNRIFTGCSINDGKVN
jgi:hypothetical protein